MNFGDLIIKGAAIAAAVAFVAAVRWARGNKASEITFRRAYDAMTILLGLASVILKAAILMHDFRNAYVVGYSSRDLPLLYLISAFWAGQPGTLLLWALMAAGFGYSLTRRRSWEPATAISFYLPTIGFLLLLMLSSDGNPFRLLAQAPPDGRGLNPLLQDPWMASHPPIVFLGYAAMTVPAVLALTALVRGGRERWLGPALRWALLSFICLGAGIILGGFWAYKVLGWGGYWGWDPVENASLVPWIVVTALVHGLLVERGTGGSLRRTNFMLAFAGYILVLYGTFLTRSGVLADFSVHSFPAGSIYRLLVIIQLFAIAACLYVFLRRPGTGGPAIEIKLSWPPLYLLLIVLFGVSALLVLLGTSWPIISSALGRPAAMQPGFYNRSNLPIYVILFGLLSVGPYLAWQTRPWRFVAARLIPSIAVATAGTAAAYHFGGRGLGPLVLFFAALLALTSNLIRFVLVARVHWLHTGAAIAHIGFALMFIGIIASSAWGASATAALPLAQPVEVMGHLMTFQGPVRGSDPETRWKIAMRQGDEAAEFAEVTMYMLPDSGEQEQIFRKPAIRRSLLSDLYIAPQDISSRGGGRFVELVKGEPAVIGEVTLTFTAFDTSGMESEHGMTVRGMVDIEIGGERETVALPITMTSEGLRPEPVRTELLPGLLLSLERMSVEQGSILVQAVDPSDPATQIMTAEVSTKPLINVLWAGTVILTLGCGVAGGRRFQEIRILAAATTDLRQKAGKRKDRKAIPAARAAGGTRRVRQRQAG